MQVGAALANIAAAALTTAELYDEQRRAREAADHARQQAAFLAEAGTALSASLDYEATLTAVARLAVPTIADWCAVDIVNDDGNLQRLAVAHVDPAEGRDGADARGALSVGSQRAGRRPRGDPDREAGVHVADSRRRCSTRRRATTSIGASSSELHLTSYMCVPLLAQGKRSARSRSSAPNRGASTTTATCGSRASWPTRASLAVENARSYARANEASRLKDEFLATLSHELRTPLNAVLGYARMLRLGTTPPDKTKAALEVVERNATALKQIIEDVLDVSRIVAGRLRLNVEPVDLPAIVQESCATVMPAADAKGVRVELIVDPLTTPVSGDADRLQQIVWNLLSNAIKFTPRGGKSAAAPLARQFPRRDRGQRHRPGHRARLPAVRVRTVPSGRRDVLARAGRARPRARDRQAADRAPRRHAVGNERRSGSGGDVHGEAAADDRPLGSSRRHRARAAPQRSASSLPRKCAAAGRHPGSRGRRRSRFAEPAASGARGCRRDGDDRGVRCRSARCWFDKRFPT